MQHEALLVGAFQAIDELFVVAGSQGGDHQGLGFAAGEQRRTMGTRQDADFRHNGTHGDQIAPVDALLGVEHRIAHDVGFHIMHQSVDLALFELAFTGEFRRRLGANFLDAIAA